MGSIIVRVIGLLFLLPGIIGVIVYLFTNLSKNVIVRTSFPILSIGSILFGVYLEMYPDSFVRYLLILLGIILLLAGINQFSLMIVNRKFSPFSWALVCIPIVLIGVGIFCIMHSAEVSATLFKILGCTLVYYGLSDVFLTIRTKHYANIYERELKKAEEAERRAREAEYVEFEVVNANDTDDNK
jgi:uncharacterized membrane protein HdeD (DUF308 family)